MLSDRNLIQVFEINLDGRVESCRIHDLLRALCIEMANENNFFCIRHNIQSNSFSTLRRLTIDNTIQYSFSISKTPKLRVLLCFSNSGEEWSWIPDEIGNLSSLTYFKLSGTFKRIPLTIRNLKKLVTLDISRAEFGIFPRTIFRMKYLKHLLCCYVYEFESNICTYLNVRNEVYLPNMETLDYVPGTIFKASSLHKFSNLRKLNLIVINDQHIDVISGKTPISEKLQHLQLNLSQKFERLNLSHYDHLAKLILKGRPATPLRLDTIEFPPNLINFSILGLNLTKDSMKVLKELPRLKILSLEGCIQRRSIKLDFS
ncbi:unnamed protein product [Fraxinus pennsylvanica]|uniref:Disease resistance R13L4/SHOC-2-like LRR domain-containing protein n=1 Tax=Fraxinus pennsylvanica TaxID=56036 RepID=A0AAD2AD81_9LAMI|nr:unnamed protein product [Fraxinus pennsylvanica]